MIIIPTIKRLKIENGFSNLPALNLAGEDSAIWAQEGEGAMAAIIF